MENIQHAEACTIPSSDPTLLLTQIRFFESLARAMDDTNIGVHVMAYVCEIDGRVRRHQGAHDTRGVEQVACTACRTRSEMNTAVGKSVKTQYTGDKRAEIH
jgi:hypothetical protein